MKALIAAALLLGIGASAATNSITTSDGKTYLNAVVQRTDPDGIVIQYTPQHGGVGVAKLKFNNLSEALQQEYRYDPNTALIFERNQESGNTKRLEDISKGHAEKERRNAELVRQRQEEEQRAIAAAAARQQQEEIAKRQQEEMAQRERLIQAMQNQSAVIYNEPVVVQSQPIVIQAPSPRYDPFPRYNEPPANNRQLDQINRNLQEIRREQADDLFRRRYQ